MRYSDEFRRQAVAATLESPLAEVADRLGVARSTLARWVDEPPAGSNRAGLERTIAALATGLEHSALVEACRSLADRVDLIEGMGGFDDKAWREYRLALTGLMEASSGDDSGLDREIAELRSASMGHPSD